MHSIPLKKNNGSFGNSIPTLISTEPNSMFSYAMLTVRRDNRFMTVITATSTGLT
jgi:hypothetical protein